MIRAFAAWSWLVSVTGAAVMLAPHVPLLLAQQITHAVRSPQ